MTLNNRRFALRWLRKLFDWLEERLHAEEIKLRQEIQGIQMDAIAPGHVNGREKTVMPAKGSSGEPPAGSRRRKHVTASAFDLRFSSHES